MANFPSLKGQLLVAMPNLIDSPFMHGVCYVCQHDEQGAIGFLVNQPIAMEVADLLQDQGIQLTEKLSAKPLLIGGPLQRERGFVLHFQEDAIHWRSTLKVADGIHVTTSQDVLEAIAQKKVPDEYMVMLGYASWAPGQLEQEITQNLWLVVPSSQEILFQCPYEARWEKAIQSIGISLAMLTESQGHA
jgi:putative transcriptional regulator